VTEADTCISVEGGWAMTARDRILDYVKQFPGRDDDEVAAALALSHRQAANQICRQLAKEGILRRQPGRRGKVVNYLIDGAPIAVPPAPQQSSTADAITEDDVKRALVKMLEPKGWAVEVAWGKQRGIDVVAIRGTERWIIECKGTGSLGPMQNNYFVGVLGELLQRMSGEASKHSIALPDVPKFRRLWSELPGNVKTKLALSALFVSRDGTVIELTL